MIPYTMTHQVASIRAAVREVSHRRLNANIGLIGHSKDSFIVLFVTFFQIGSQWLCPIFTEVVCHPNSCEGFLLGADPLTDTGKFNRQPMS